MEKTVTIRLEDYNQMRDDLKNKTDMLEEIFGSIKSYRDDTKEIGFFDIRPIIKVEIDKKKILEALGYDPDIEMCIKY